MSYNTSNCISLADNAERVDDLVIKEEICEFKQQQPDHSVEEIGKWMEKFGQKFLEHLSMRSLIASLALSMLVVNFDVFCNSHSRLNQREYSSPRPFFPSNVKKYLTDYYTGNDATPENLLQYSEIVIVMYYAPWSRRCIRARLIFESVARSFSGSSDISFAAVNCFARHGECKKSYRTHTYPVIVAYIGKQSLMYTGFLASDYIYRWISHLRNPIRRLISTHDMARFLNEFDVAIIAFFDAEKAFVASQGFQQYLKATLIVSQRQDLLDKVGFAIVTDSSLAMTINSSPKPWIQLKAWDQTLEYDGMNLTATRISDWIRNQALKWKGLQWINPETYGIAKSGELLSVLRDGPTVMVFLDRQVLYSHNWAVSVVEQTIMEYYACGEVLIDEMKLRTNNRDVMMGERSRTIAVNRHKCLEINTYTREIRKCCMTEKASLMPHCFQCRYKNGINFSKDGRCSQIPLFSYNTFSSLFHNVPCLSVLSMQNEEQLLSDCCSLLISKNKRLDISEDTLEQCAKYKLARELYHQISGSAASTCYPFDETSVAGLSCSKNNSLRFVAIDVRYNDYILERMRKPYDGKTVTLIVDPHTERTFFMEAEFSRLAFREFLRAFHSGTLVPHVVSQVSPKKAKDNHLLNDNLSVLLSTTAKSFEIDLNTSEDTVIFFSGGSWHGPSASVMHIYHSVAHYFRPFLRFIKFHMYGLFIFILHFKLITFLFVLFPLLFLRLHSYAMVCAD